MRSSFKTILTFTLILLSISGIYFIVIYGMGYKKIDPHIENDTLTIKYKNGEIPFDANHKFWMAIEPLKVHLFPQAAKIPYGNEERDVWVRGAFNDREITFFLEFEDKTENRDTTLNPDACAIMLLPKQSPAITQMMGHGGKANIWHWSADRDAKQHRFGMDSVLAVRELIAVGPGTQNPMAFQNVQGKSWYRNGKWQVLMRRPVENQQEDELNLVQGSDFKIAFAVWDGAKAESFGIKSVSIVRTLNITKDKE
jgi:DMSO reductase family type II enzyme heme b subunit